MTKVAIDQLLQVTAPTSSVRATSQADSTDGQRFRTHLDRATEAVAPKDTPAEREPDVSQLDEEEPLEVSGEQQDTATTEQDETTQGAESDSAQPVRDEETSSEGDTDQEDEVTLSSAAAALEVEGPHDSETQVVPSGADSAPTTSDSNDQQSNQQTTQHAIEVSVEASTQTTPPEAGELELTPSSATVDQEVSHSQLPASEQQTTEVTQVSAIAQSQAVASAAVLADSPQAKEPNAARQPESKSFTAANSQQQTELPVLHDSESNQSERTNNQPNPFGASVFQTSELPNASELEPKLAITNTSVESHNGQQSPSSHTDSLLNVEKSVGLVGANKSEALNTNSNQSTTSDTPTVDRIRFVQRVSGAIRSAHQRDGQIQLRLSPPELGNLKIQLTVSESAIAANLEAETSAARTILLDNLPALRERLADQGITIEKFNVDIGREGQQQADSHGAGERNGQNGSSDSGRRSTESSQTDTATAETVSQPALADTEVALDIRI